MGESLLTISGIVRRRHHATVAPTGRPASPISGPYCGQYPVAMLDLEIG
jgi:hypothetical protein